jgi:hypothetical protein
MRIVGLLRGWLSFFAFRIALHRIGVITADTHRFPEFGLPVCGWRRSAKAQFR